MKNFFIFFLAALLAAATVAVPARAGEEKDDDPTPCSVFLESSLDDFMACDSFLELVDNDDQLEELERFARYLLRYLEPLKKNLLAARSGK